MRSPEAAAVTRQTQQAPTSSAPRRGSEYAQLSRQIKEAGLLERRPGYYVWKIAVTVGMLAAGWTAFALVGDSWWQLAVAAFLAVVFTQIGFLGHDAGHRQIFGSRRANDVVGVLLGNLGIGLSYGWWVGKHNRHHAHPNTEGADPDIARRRAGLHRRAGARQPGRWPGSCSATRPTCSSRCCCWKRSACTSRASARCPAGQPATGRWRRRCSPPTSPATSPRCSWCSRRSRPWCSSSCSRACSASTWAAPSPPTTRACRSSAAADQTDFLRRQVLTSRNVRGGWLTDFALGGLNYQIEHHLFPCMPRPNLRRAQALVRAFCQQRGVPYCQSQPGGLLRPGPAPPQHRRQASPPRHRGLTGGPSRRPASRPRRRPQAAIEACGRPGAETASRRR